MFSTKNIPIRGALLLSALLAPLALHATTANTISDFGGIEEPAVIYHPSSNSFTNDSFQNITNPSTGVFQVLLRYSTSQWDGDRTTSNTDRQRGELKTLGANQLKGETYVYTTTWRTNPQFVGSGSFCHITQLKPTNGTEGSSGAPLITTSIFAGTNSAAVRYASASFSPADVFSPQIVRNITWAPNTWLAEQIKVTTTGDGQNTGQVVVSLNGDGFQGVTNVEVCRPASTQYYPKWGLYRGASTTSGFSANDYVQHSNVTATKGSAGTPQVSAPTFSPAAGTYTSTQSVTITSATSGASIRYTLDGSTPSETAGTVYSSPVSISATATLKAIAYKSGSTDSPVTSGTYTISIATTVAAPTFSPGGGTYTSAQSVTISSATSGASIRYTTDGSTPSETAGTLGSSVTIGSTTTLKAIAYKSGSTDSSVTSAAYTINIGGGGNPITLEAESLSPVGTGATVSTSSDTNASGGIVEFLNSTAAGQTMTLTTPSFATAGTYQVQLRYKPNTSRGQLTVKIDGTQVGGTVDEYNTSQTYITATLGSANLAAGTHTIVLTVTGKNASSSAFLVTADTFTFTPSQAQVAAPAFNPAAGTYSTTQSVTITSSTSGASIRYTTDGSTPSETAGTLYSGPVSISSTTTLKAIAYASGSTDSTVTSATYTISVTPPPTLNFEAESLSPVGTGATASTSSDTNASGGIVEFLNSTAAGQLLTLTTPSFATAGTYQVQLRYKPNTSRGQLTVKVDGVQVGGTVDEYNTSQTYITATLGNATLATGPHTIVLTVTGKNASSSAFLITADKLTFVGQ